MLNVAGMRIRSPCAAVTVGIAASVTVIAAMAVAGWPTTNTWFAADATVGCTIWIVPLSVAAVPPALPVIVAVVSAVFQVMLNVAGMRIRMSLVAVIVAVAASVTVTGLIAVAASPTTNTWFAADANVGCTIWIVRL